jgi:two-component system NtrC family sensor kinase
VLQVINASPGDLKPVFDTMLEKAMRLCTAAFGSLYTFNGKQFHSVVQHGVPPAYAAFRAEHPPSPAPGGTLARVIETRRALQVVDLTLEKPYLDGNPNARAMVELGGVRTILTVPLCRDDAIVGMITVYRQEVRPFTDKQIALLENFAAQAVIAMENARLLTETREALEQQTATAEVLRVINASPGDLEPVFDAILEKAHNLCGATLGSLQIYDGDYIRFVAVRGAPEALLSILRKGIPRPNTPAIPLDRTSQVADSAELLARNPDSESLRAIVELGQVRTQLHVPLQKDGVVIGRIAAARREVRLFTDKQIALLENFATQAVIAMENARLLTEQREALEQQTATAEVLQVINANPGDLTPVFDAMLEKAMRLCGAAFGLMSIYDGGRFHRAAERGVPKAFTEFHQRNVGSGTIYGPGTAPALLVDGADLIQNSDLMAEEVYHQGEPNRRALVDLGGARSHVSVALRKDQMLLGYLAIYRQEVKPFAAKEVALLQNFAAQAVIAMENARLLTEQREALEQQTATAEVLQVINASPGNVKPVFDAILEKAVRLCQSTFGCLLTYDGQLIHFVAAYGAPPEVMDLFRERRPPAKGAPTGRIAEGEPFVHVINATDQDIYRAGDRPTVAFVEQLGARTALFVGLRQDATLLGYLVIFRREVQPFSDKEIGLVMSFAAQAVVAMENARLLDEIRQRQEELRVTFENMGDGVAMFDETQHLVAWNGKFQKVFDLPGDLLQQHRTYDEYLRFLADRGDFGAGVDTAEQIRELVASTGQTYGYERTRPDGRVIEIRRNPVPDGGFVLIFSDITERKRSEAEIRAARDAAENALRELRATQASLIQAEKMASLGQLTAGIAHEIKNPLNFVNNFASLSVDLLDELKQAATPGLAVLDATRRAEVDELTNTLASNLDKINEHGRRADGIVRGMLEHSRGSSGERRLVELNALVDEALNLAYHGARAQDQTFNVTLQRELGEGIAPITLAPQDVTRVLLNLFSNGFYAARERQRTETVPGFEPTVTVTTRDLDGAVEIRVRDNGVGIPAEIKDRLFQPFFTTKPPGEGTGLGLSMSYDIITQQHGGTISVDSKMGEYSEFTVWLPRSS